MKFTMSANQSSSRCFSHFGSILWFLSNPKLHLVSISRINQAMMCTKSEFLQSRWSQPAFTAEIRSNTNAKWPCWSQPADVPSESTQASIIHFQSVPKLWIKRFAFPLISHFQHHTKEKKSQERKRKLKEIRRRNHDFVRLLLISDIPRCSSWTLEYVRRAPVGSFNKEWRKSKRSQGTSSFILCECPLWSFFGQRFDCQDPIHRFWNREERR